MVYVQSKYILNGYNCATFDEGCPDVQYLSYETYLCKTYNQLVAIICFKKNCKIVLSLKGHRYHFCQNLFFCYYCLQYFSIIKAF